MTGECEKQKEKIIVSTYLLADSGEDDEKGDENGEEDKVQGESLDIPRDGGAVTVTVQGGPAIVTKRVEPALHDASALLQHKNSSTLKTLITVNIQQHVTKHSNDHTS